MSIFEQVEMPLAEAAKLVAWRIMQWLRIDAAYAASTAVKDRGGKAFVRTGMVVDHMIDPETAFADETDMDGFAAWLRGHGITDASRPGIQALYYEYALIAGRRMMSERCMFMALGASGIEKYRPHVLRDGHRTKPTRYRVLPARPLPERAGKPKTYRSLGDVSKVTQPMRRAA